MAWGNNELKFDVEEISKMRRDVEDTVKELNTCKSNLKEALSNIEKDWDTPAGRKFMNEYDWDWIPQVDKYIKVLEKLEELLGVAEQSYADVEDAASRLDF